MSSNSTSLSREMKYSNLIIVNIVLFQIKK